MLLDLTSDLFLMKLISKANYNLWDKSKNYFENIVNEDIEFKKIKLGFLALNKKLNEKNLVDFKICELNLNKSYLDLKNRKITFCSNLIENEYVFKEELIYNLIHIFDFERYNINKDDLEQNICIEVRKWNLSKKCKDKTCYENRLYKKFNTEIKENYHLKNIIKNQLNICKQDLSPILDFKYLFN